MSAHGCGDTEYCAQQEMKKRKDFVSCCSGRSRQVSACVGGRTYLPVLPNGSEHAA